MRHLKRPFALAFVLLMALGLMLSNPAMAQDQGKKAKKRHPHHRDHHAAQAADHSKTHTKSQEAN